MKMFTTILFIMFVAIVSAQETFPNIVTDSTSGTIKKFTVCRNRTMPDDPLYIIDGTLLSYEDFTKIKPTDITSISVLKNADSTMFCNNSHKSVLLIKTKKSLIGRELRKYERKAKRLARKQSKKP